MKWTRRLKTFSVKTTKIYFIVFDFHNYPILSGHMFVLCFFTGRKDNFGFFPVDESGTGKSIHLRWGDFHWLLSNGVLNRCVIVLCTCGYTEERRKGIFSDWISVTFVDENNVKHQWTRQKKETSDVKWWLCGNNGDEIYNAVLLGARLTLVYKIKNDQAKQEETEIGQKFDKSHTGMYSMHLFHAFSKYRAFIDIVIEALRCKQEC